MTRSPQDERAQRERAQQSWELVIVERPEPERLEAARKLLRIKRFERESLSGPYPLVVRRGAEVDLAPLEAALSRLGVRSALRERRPDV